MRLVGEERREFQRIRIDPAMEGSFDGAVSIVEIGVLGARIRHQKPLRTDYGELRFQTGDDEVTLRCEVVRSRGESPEIESAVRFVAAVGESGDHLRNLLARLVTGELELKRNMPKIGIPAEAPVDGDKTVRTKAAGFLCYRFENGRWSKHRAFLPEQPATGFTVARWVEPSEVTRLCQVYEAADAEGRRLIQLFAELSVSDELEIPPRA